MTIPATASARPTRANVIILTSGHTGSSVLAGLLGKGGYWMGDTVKKEYDTYENSALVRLNQELLVTVGIAETYMAEFSASAIDRVAELSEKIDSTRFQEFVRSCDSHLPWAWKDPRLWLTIRFWSRCVPLDQCKFIVLTRNMLQCWISCTLRRQIRSYRAFRHYERSVEATNVSFLNSLGASYLSLTYDDLIARPEATIDRLNEHLGSHIAIDDLRAVYRGRLHQTPRASRLDQLKAVMIYAKNYSQRDAGSADRRRHKYAGV
jgi:hypothetical protein